MAFATQPRAFPAYSPTSTPILDVLRPAPLFRAGKLTAGEYVFLSSLFMAVLVALPRLHEVMNALALPSTTHVVALLFTPAAALASAFLVHEAGHLVAGWIAGLRLRRIGIGSYSRCERFYACEMVRVGCLFLEPRKPVHLRRQLLILLLGGPVAGLLFAAGLELFHDWSRAGLIVQLRVHLFAAFSMLVSVASLLPDTSRRGNFSDGARLLMLCKNDELAARWLAILQIQLGLNQAVHPRDWDPALIARATQPNDESRDAVAALWLAYLWTSEKQDIASATKYLEAALAAAASCPGSLRARLFLEAAVFQAWFRENPAKARSWAALIRNKNLGTFEKKRLEIALLWADGKSFDAFEKLPDYFVSLRQMPESPARALAEKSALEWKRQMESRMLTRAWRGLYAQSQQAGIAAHGAVPSSAGAELPSC